MNNCIFGGNLCADPTFGQTTNNVAYATFRIAVRRNYKNPEGKYDSDFFSCRAWRGAAEIVNKYCHRGDRIVVSGYMQNRMWEKDGVKHYVDEIVVEDICMPSRRIEDGNEVPPPPALPPQDDFSETDEELPF